MIVDNRKFLWFTKFYFCVKKILNLDSTWLIPWSIKSIQILFSGHPQRRKRHNNQTISKYRWNIWKACIFSSSKRLTIAKCRPTFLMKMYSCGTGNSWLSSWASISVLRFEMFSSGNTLQKNSLETKLFTPIFGWRLNKKVSPFRPVLVVHCLFVSVSDMSDCYHVWSFLCALMSDRFLEIWFSVWWILSILPDCYHVWIFDLASDGLSLFLVWLILWLGDLI